MLSRRLNERLLRVEQILLGQPNVIGVGCGWKETRGELTGVPAWRVYVRRKLGRWAIPKDERIPPRLEDFDTDVIEAHRASDMLGGGTSLGQLASGTTISNLRKVGKISVSGDQPSGLGTLGFLALANGRRDRQMVLVSNRHVLLAHGAGHGDSIYAPVIAHRGGQSIIRPDSLEAIAEILDEGEESNYRYQFRGELPADYFVDCASARMLDGGNNGLHHLFSLDPLPVRPQGPRRAYALDVIGGRAPRVRKLGGATGSTEGRLVDVSAPVESAGGAKRLRNLVIRGNSGAFVTPGDSGALVINEHDEALGMIWGRSDRDPTVAYACHIHPVLHRLNVTMLTNSFV